MKNAQLARLARLLLLAHSDLNVNALLQLPLSYELQLLLSNDARFLLLIYALHQRLS